MTRCIFAVWFSLVLVACAQPDAPTAASLETMARAPVLEFHAPPADDGQPLARYRLDRQFDTLVEFYLKDEVAAFGRGEETAVGDLFKLVTADAEDVRRSYARGESAVGDRRFLGRQVLLSGSVLGISRDDDKVPYVVLRDGVLRGTKARLARDSAALAQVVEKDRTLALVCTGRGLIEGTPVFDDCRLAESVARGYARALVAEFSSFAHGQAVSPEATELAVRFESLARAVDDTVDCSRGCVNQLDHRRAAEVRTLGAIVRSMRAGGMRIDTATERTLTGAAGGAGGAGGAGAQGAVQGG